MEGGLLGKEGEKKGDKSPQQRPERDVQKTNKHGRSGRETKKTTLTAPRDRVTNEKQLQREVGRGGGRTKSVRKENSFEHKERKRSVIFGGPWLLASSQRL